MGGGAPGSHPGMSEQPKNPVDPGVDDDDQDSEPTMMAPDGRRPDGSVADPPGQDDAGTTGDGQGGSGPRAG